MWQCGLAVVLALVGCGLIGVGARMEHKHVLWNEERDAIAEPKVVPIWVETEELYTMGWKPCNDGSGLWEVDWDKLEPRKS